MKYLSLLSACLIALALFLAQADFASADWRGQHQGGSGSGQYGRTTAQQRGTTAQQRGAANWQQRGTTQQRGTAMAQRGTGDSQAYRAPAQARGQARPGRAGELDPALLAGAFGGLGLLAFVGGRKLRPQTV